MISDEAVEAALTKARNARREAHGRVFAAVDRGDMPAAERLTEEYLAAAAEEDRAERAVIEGHSATNPYRSQA